MSDFLSKFSLLSSIPFSSHQITAAVTTCFSIKFPHIPALDITNRCFPVFTSCCHPKFMTFLHMPVQISFPAWSLPRSQESIGDICFGESVHLWPMSLILHHTHIMFSLCWIAGFTFFVCCIISSKQSCVFHGVLM